MFVLLGVTIAAIVYIVTFSSDFTADHVDRVKLFLIIVLAVVLLLGILGSVLGGGR